MPEADPNQPQQKPSLIVDDDWKAQAQAEKQRLAEQEKQRRDAATPAASAAQGSPDQDDDHDHQHGRIPKADFQTLLGTMISNAIMYMGGIADPQTGRPIVAPDHARFHIDLLAVLEEKTKGNLTEEEASALRRAVSELRLEFLELMKAIEQAALRAGPAGMNPNQASPGLH